MPQDRHIHAGGVIKISGLIAGTAKIDITPDEPIRMGGFGQRTGLSRGIGDRLYSGALYLSQGPKRLLFITSDLICIPDSLAEEATELICQQTGLDSSAICLTASHTHSGPELMEYFKPTAAVKRYRKMLLEKLVLLAKNAEQNCFPARASETRGIFSSTINRRTSIHGNPVDNRLFVLAIHEINQNKPKAILYGCACHPVCLGHNNYLINADFPGQARLILENRYPDCHAHFFNMAEGNLIPNTRPPADSLDTRGYSGGSSEDAKIIGSALAQSVLEALGKASCRETLELDSVMEDIKVNPNYYHLSADETIEKLTENQKTISQYLGEDFTRFTPEDLSPLDNLWADASNLVVKNNMNKKEMQHLMAAVCRYFVFLNRLFNPSMQQPISVKVQLIRMGESLLLALPGEVLVEAAFAWRKLAGEKAYIASLANGYLGYLPHSDNYCETEWENKYETIMSALEPDAMTKIIAVAERMRNRLFNTSKVERS
jgi:hypothetical protein